MQPRYPYPPPGYPVTYGAAPMVPVQQQYSSNIQSSVPIMYSASPQLAGTLPPPPQQIIPMQYPGIHPHYPGMPPQYPGMLSQMMPTGVAPLMMPPGMQLPPRMPTSMPMSRPMLMHPPPLPPAFAPMMTPPPGWTPALQQVHTAQNPAAVVPLTIYIGKIPPELKDPVIKKIFGVFGKVQRWNHPVDSGNNIKAFGFVTYEHAQIALRCCNVLGTIEISEGKYLVVKVGTKETAVLESLTRVTISLFMTSSCFSRIIICH
jgi:hypothetical protein